MRVVIRADASHFLGTGHVMRQLTLADGLAKAGAEIQFICRDHPGQLADVIRNRGFACHLVPRRDDGILGASLEIDAADTAALAREIGATWVFVDHYAADARWETSMPCPVLAIDDLFDRPHDCAILLNQNLGATAQDYAGLAGPDTLYLMGVDYALLRPEFADLRPAALARRTNANLQDILITMGGSDEPNATGWILDMLDQMPLPEDVHLTIVMGPTAPHLEDIRNQASGMACATTVLAGTSQMEQLMVDADLAVGAAGSTSWERCALALPTVMVVLAENQRGIGLALDQAGAAVTVDMGADAALLNGLRPLLSDPQTRQRMAAQAAEIVDGGGTDRVLHALQNFRSQLV